ncbi:Uncharacterised protein [Klebsiella aerogenes]|nr:Uncharacterised protein [Klebsiella aerogenes]
MDSGGASESYRLVDPRARQILLIAGVAGFVDHAEQGAEQVVFVVAVVMRTSWGDAAGRTGER